MTCIFAAMYKSGNGLKQGLCNIHVLLSVLCVSDETRVTKFQRQGELRLLGHCFIRVGLLTCYTRY